jgi:hypothetical protein
VIDDRGDRPDVVAVEVPLSGDGPLAVAPGGTPDPGSPAPTNWRKIVGSASLIGAALGIALAIVVLAFGRNDDDGRPIGDDTANTLATDPASLITTPPTLDTLPVPQPLDRTPGVGGLATIPLPVDRVVVPTYPTLGPDRPLPGGVDQIDLFAATMALGNDVPRRSSTHLELGVGGYSHDFTIVRDSAADRFRVELRDDVAIVLDGTTGYLWEVSVSGEDQRSQQPADGRALAEQLGVDSMGEFFDRLLQGPVRPDTISSATVSLGELVALDDGNSVARAFTVEVPGALVPEWQLYALGPTSEFVPSDRPPRLTYTVYVDQHNEIRRVVGISDLGGIPQLVVHDIETLTEPIPIDTPEAAVAPEPDPPPPSG